MQKKANQTQAKKKSGMSAEQRSRRVQQIFFTLIAVIIVVSMIASLFMF